MRWIIRGLGALWETIGIAVCIAVGYWLGSYVGYGRGARDTARLVIEMRQGAYETPEPWEAGRI